MITITIKMKTKEYMPKIDRLFVEGLKMNKTNDCTYKSDKDVFMPCLNSAEELMKLKWFRDDVDEMYWKIDNEPVEDLKTCITHDLIEEDYI